MESKNGYKFKVLWSPSASTALAKIYNIDHRSVYKLSKGKLSNQPHMQSYGCVDFPDFRYNGYHWTIIQNVAICYAIHEDQRIVTVDACYFLNTAWAHHVFYGIEPEEEE